MACIDIYAPGRVLNIPFLMEQIWLRTRSKKLLVTEVYDFVLQASDDKELKEFLVSSPHLCRIQSRAGWIDNFKSSRVRDYQSGWGWFYRHQKLEGDCLKMTLPNTVGPPAADTIEPQGLDEDPQSVQWSPQIKDSNLAMMVEIKKSLYKVELETPIQPLETLGTWFRLIVEPFVLDIPGPRRLLNQPLIELILPLYSVTASVSCPLRVRQVIEDKLAQMRARDGMRAATADTLNKAVVRAGFGAVGTSTRIEDHRILLGTYSPMHLSIHGQPIPTLAFFGAQTVRIPLPKMPVFRNGNLKEDHSQLKEVNATVYSWSGGSVRNMDRDLVTVIRAILNEAGMAPPKMKEDLAIRLAPYRYSEACFLIDLMVKIGLLRYENSNCVLATTDPKTQKKSNYSGGL
jgi:hypothetical protein